MALGGPINWLAGAERYPYRTFLLWDVSGQLLGALIPLGIGYTFAASWGEAERLFGAISGFTLTFLGILVIFLALFRTLRARRARVGNPAGASPHRSADHILPAQRDEDTFAASSRDADSADEETRPTILILVSRSGI